jgi:hypothetical protein
MSIVVTKAISFSERNHIQHSQSILPNSQFFDMLLFFNGCDLFRALIPHRADHLTEPKFSVFDLGVGNASVTAAASNDGKVQCLILGSGFRRNNTLQHTRFICTSFFRRFCVSAACGNLDETNSQDRVST